MRRIPRLPEDLSRGPFTVEQALARGVRASELRLKALDKPFHGVRSTNLDMEILANRCLAYSVRMHPAAAFSHSTAAALWQMPLPLRQHVAIHVVVPVTHRAPSGRGIIGHAQRNAPDEVIARGGMRVCSPAATWCQLAESLDLESLIAVGDYVLTGDPYRNVLPLASRRDIERAMAVRESGPGHRRRIAALRELHEGPLSRPETFCRLLLGRCRLPVPRVNEAIYGANGVFIAIPDLAWHEYKVALEYEGDFHREKNRFRRDIRRVEALVDHGWLVIKISADDLFDRPEYVVRLVERRLRSRGWQGSIDLRRITTFTK